jgi:hypothetical protein
MVKPFSVFLSHRNSSNSKLPLNMVPTHMKRRFTIVVALLLSLCLWACGGEERDALSGRWRCDGEATLALLEACGGMSADRLAAGAALLDGIAMSIDAKAGTLNMDFGGTTEQRRFSLSHDGERVFVLAEQDGASRLELRDEDTLWFTDSRAPGKVIVFVKE